MTVLTALYEQGMKWVSENREGRNIFMFLSNSLGNFKDRKEFFDDLKPYLKKGDMLLIGVSLQIDPKIIDKAYNTNLKLANPWILNNLSRINR